MENQQNLNENETSGSLNNSAKTKITAEALLVTSSPHLHSGNKTRSIMFDVIIALIPTLIMSAVLFGHRSLMVVGVCVLACVASEFICRIIMRRNQTVTDLSAIVTGLLLGFNFPSTIPLWQAALAGVFAIVVAKQMFGGIGCNFLNPALAGRVFAMVSFSENLDSWVNPLIGNVDTVTSATPLAIIEKGGTMVYTTTDLFFGFIPGCIGETCVATLLLGGVYLVVRGVIKPTIPLVYVGTVGAFAFVLGQNPLLHILAGGLILGAVFMATDYTTSPLNFTGKIIYAVGCGVLTVLIRVFGSLPEGVSFAIIFMNILVPLIERFTINRGLKINELKEAPSSLVSKEVI